MIYYDWHYDIVYSLRINVRRKETEQIRATAEGLTVFELSDYIRRAKVFKVVSEGFMAAMNII